MSWDIVILLVCAVVTFLLTQFCYNEKTKKLFTTDCTDDHGYGSIRHCVVNAITLETLKCFMTELHSQGRGPWAYLHILNDLLKY
jgi:hypothetical protein